MIGKVQSGVIVVPWDFTESSIIALKKAMELVNSTSDIRVTHVATPLEGPDNGILYQNAEALKCVELKNRFRRQLKDAGIQESIQIKVIFGYSAPEIARFADKIEASLIVMGPCQQRGLRGLLAPRLAQEVVKHSNCAVLTLQQREKDLQFRQGVVPAAKTRPQYAAEPTTV